MKTIHYLLVSTLAIALYSCAGNEPAQEPVTEQSEITESEVVQEVSALPSPGNISLEEMQELQAMKNVLIVDVRTPQEFNEGAIPNAQLIDVTAPDFKDKISELAKDQPIMVYCRSGARSANAMSIMNEMGFNEVYNLEGGYLNYDANKEK